MIAIKLDKKTAAIASLIVLLLLYFFLLAIAVKAKLPLVTQFDSIINAFIYSGICEALDPLAKFLTHLADYRFLLYLTVFFAVLLAVFKQPVSGAVFFLFYTASRELRTITKDFVGRTRPKEGDGYSFPSGHMMYASFFYGYLLYILFRSLKKETQKKWKKPLLACYFLLLALIGWSRIYLKDHFATDILGGTALGLAWLLIAILVTEWLEKKAQHRKAADPQKLMNVKRA